MGKGITMNLDLDSIPGSDSQRIHNLIAEADFFEVPTLNDLRASPDEYQYTITVVAGNSLHTVHVTDTAMPEPLRPLVEELTELAETAA
ncbi:MAG: hypothetical protein EHM40_08720 [Chloroflexi bacterium]|nr:MAG: hypothetical protein EHM40_08720 [Chloroflexota bacterium]